MPEFVLHAQLDADSFFVRDLPLSQLRLNNVKVVPWLLLVPRKDSLRDMDDLSRADRAQLMEEMAQTSRALKTLYAPDKINVAALGNIVPQLHVHVIARFTSDPAWPHAVFGRLTPEIHPADAIATIVAKLNANALWA